MTKDEIACRSPSTSWSPSPTLDTCYDARGNSCNARHSMSQCDLAADVASLAEWIESNRAHLPRHIFAVDSTPAHFSSVHRVDNGRWRTSTGQIWSKFAPSVHVIHAHQVLVDQPGAHTLGKDALHWCIDHQAYEQYVSFLLTAVVANVRKAPLVPWQKHNAEA